jgi:hypothetical protein
MELQFGIAKHLESAKNIVNTGNLLKLISQQKLYEYRVN